MARLFADRLDAGRRLAPHLDHYRGCRDLIVLGLPRGGVLVAHAVAFALGAPLDVFVVRKLGVPGHEELAMGAIAAGGVRVLNRTVLERLEISDRDVEWVALQEVQEMERRERAYRGGAPAPRIEGRTAILVDDGVATGATMRVAILALRELGAGRVVGAVPVGAASTCRELGALADEMVCAETPTPFVAVGAWYDDFTPTEDEDVRRVLEQADPVRAR